MASVVRNVPGKSLLFESHYMLPWRGQPVAYGELDDTKACAFMERAVVKCDINKNPVYWPL